MQKLKVLIVEDEPKVAMFIKQGLDELGFAAEIAYDGLYGKKLSATKKFDVIILDVIIPHISGIQLCREIRQNDPDIKILMLTALDSLDDKLEGFSAGADDYLVKPFDFPELVARVNSLLKRGRKSEKENDLRDEILTALDLQVNIGTKNVTRAGKEIVLTAKEFALLELLLRNKNRVLSKVDIAEKIWNINFDTGTNVIEVYINFLRRKIDKNFSQKLIHTLIGMGYTLRDK
ncbi:MAG: DNA-binding response regulator [Bacteroidetes bacterium RIFOXYA12_FULL_35_11]|nr:MAG: DNA-binding response regulator [Bacteroidetes bacterium GWF2_35_48]OFY81666.1 MAG: DNA-binding response regulator [Bacteroidetes bacterium RIFOXYA12_FULL_35_11]OFY97830.1 MAG: DNA-binding response regulator [Bacteroidetes bacterium RIFOXYC12_FULL_35_7]HBX50240.1 DNA-binding response regulator [Bacteroidales bacterium]